VEDAVAQRLGLGFGQVASTVRAASSAAASAITRSSVILPGQPKVSARGLPAERHFRARTLSTEDSPCHCTFG